MRRTLENLYYGNINPTDKTIVRGSPYDKGLRAMSELETKIELLLTAPIRELFSEYSTISSDIMQITALESFIEGFRLGANILLETLQEDDGSFQSID
ncbi:DUF6809 family protein [Clostridium sp. D33t1_170424_F3]|uniref:DUF6809 family protein n=1 Tax=Clostridium sp. D33t1_170424_F3 TaxID=2787099 RepID=UPI0018AC1017|nr:DUF6809 family protein [Clostridium sp. D33t1_170424_F3]